MPLVGLVVLVLVERTAQNAEGSLTPCGSSQSLTLHRGSSQSLTRLHCGIKCARNRNLSALRNQRLENAFLVQSVQRLCFIVFDFAVLHLTLSGKCHEAYTRNPVQETAVPVQFVPGRWFLVFDFEAEVPEPGTRTRLVYRPPKLQ
eukprot:1522636-Rhodomonas_salina.1